MKKEFDLKNNMHITKKSAIKVDHFKLWFLLNESV